MKMPPTHWETIAARVTLHTTPAPEPPPLGLATRVVAQWRSNRREAALLRWSRWSLRTALASAALCTVLALLNHRKPEPPVLLPTPSANFVTPSFLAP